MAAPQSHSEVPLADTTNAEVKNSENVFQRWILTVMTDLSQELRNDLWRSCDSSGIASINALARAVDRAKNNATSTDFLPAKHKNSSSLLDALVNRLELRGRLLNNGLVEINESLSGLLVKAPNLASLRRLTARNLCKLLLDDENLLIINQGDASLIRELWQEGNSLRIEYNGLQLRSLAILEDHCGGPLLPVNKLSKSTVENIANECAKYALMDADAIRRMFEDGSERRVQLRTELKEKQDAAKAELQDLKTKAADLQKSMQNGGANVGSRVSDLAKRLGVSGLSPVDAPDPAADLNRVLDTLQEIDRELPVGNWGRDEDLVAYSCGGQALFGVCMDPDISVVPIAAQEPILEKPVVCTLMGPSLVTTSATHRFTMASLCDKFTSAIDVAGSSFASSIALSGYGSSAEAGLGSSKTRESEATSRIVKKSSSAGVVAVAVTPMASFRIGVDSARLSIEALRELAEVRSEGSAKEFMMRFGSHIPTGNQHFGGLYSIVCKTSSTDEENASTLQNIAAAKLNVNAGGGASFYGVSASASVAYESFSETANGSATRSVTRQATVDISVRLLGPPAGNLDGFNRLLALSNKTWRLIDRGPPNSFRPVWEVILRHHREFVNQAQILQATFQKRAVGVATANFRTLTAADSAADQAAANGLRSRLELALAEVTKDVVDFANPQNQCDAITRLAMLSSVLLGLHSTTGLDLSLLLYSHTTASTLLGNVAAQTDWTAAHSLFRSMFPETLRARLLQSGIKLDKRVITIVTAAQPDVRPLPKLDRRATFENLPDRLRLLADQLASVPDDLHRECCKAINLAVENCPNHARRDEFLHALQALGRREDDGDFFYLYNDPANVNYVADKLAGILSQTDDTTLSPIPTRKHNMKPGQARAIKIHINIQDINPNGLSVSDIMVDHGNPVTPLDQLLQRIIHRQPIHAPQHDLAESSTKSTKPEVSARAKDFAQTARDWATIFDDQTSDGPSKSPVLKDEVSSTQVAIELANGLTLPARCVVFRQLLEQRVCVPIFTKRADGVLLNHMQALRYVNLSIGPGPTVNVLTDNALPRLALVCNVPAIRRHTPALAKAMLNMTLLSTDTTNADEHPTEPWLAEYGIGFAVLPQNGTDLMQAYHVLVVFGDVRHVLPFLRLWADIVIVETSIADADTAVNEASLSAFDKSEPFGQPFLWAAGMEATMKSFDLRGRKIYRSTVDSLAMNLIKAFLVIPSKGGAAQATTPPIRKGTDRCSLADAVVPGAKCDLVNVRDITAVLDGVDFVTARRDLRLQNIFIEEEDLRRKLLGVVDRLERARLQEQVDARRKWRLSEHNAKNSSELPIMQLFRSILRLPDDVVRTVALMELTSQLDERSLKQLQPLHEARRVAEQALRDSQRGGRSTEQTMRLAGLRQAKYAISSSMVGIEHLWRELSHIYSTNSTNYSGLPVAAAKVMLSGFQLELLDGDAAAIPQMWVDAVVSALNRALSKRLKRSDQSDPVRIFVMSVLGVQSSGKSTLLNTAFGTRMRTSVGQCTRGVNFQMVRRRGYQNDPVDYILLLDTEGIRSPDFVGLAGSVEHDNQLAIVSVLLADACALIINGEDTSPLRDIIPVVAMAFASSNLAANACGHSRTSLFGVFTKLDFRQESQCEQVATKMQQVCYEAVTQGLSLIGPNTAKPGELPSSASSFAAVFGGFSGSGRASDETSDIRFVGQLNRGELPPFDIPNAEYGRRVSAAIAHMQRRVMSAPDWSVSTLAKWGEHLRLVAECASDPANIAITVESVAEASSLMKLKDQVHTSELQVAKAYNAAYQSVYAEFLKAASSDGHVTVDTWVKQLDVKMASDITAAEKILTELLRRPEFAKWKEATNSSWKSFLVQSRTFWSNQLRSICDNYLSYDKVAGELIQKMQRDVCERYAKKELNDDSQADDVFNDIFSAVLNEADQRFRSQADSIPLRVSQLYDTQTRNVYKLAEGMTKVEGRKDVSSSTPIGQQIADFIASLLPKGQSSASSDAVQKAIATSVEHALLGVTHFQEQAVLTVAHLAESAVRDNQLLDRASKIHMQVCRALCRTMKERQTTWELTNNIRARVEASRGSMRQFFDDTRKNLSLQEKLGNQLRIAIQTRMDSSAREYIIIGIAENITATAPWARSPSKLAAHVDLILLGAADNIGRLLIALGDPSKHYVDSVTSLVQKAQQINGQIVAFKDAVHSAFSVAQAQAKSVGVPGAGETAYGVCPAVAMLTHFRSHVFPVLREAAESIDGKIYGSLTGTDVSSVLVTVLNQLVFPSFNSEKDQREIASAVVAEFGAQRFAGLDARPRCSAHCPGCGMTCNRPAGHQLSEGGVPDDKLHDCYHQPSGLFGWRYVGSQKLCELSCKKGVEEDRTFIWQKETRRYREFSSTFPAWKTPSQVRYIDDITTMAREFLFYKFNKEIAEHFGCMPSDPPSIAPFHREQANIRAVLESRAA